MRRRLVPPLSLSLSRLHFSAPLPFLPPVRLLVHLAERLSLLLPLLVVLSSHPLRLRRATISSSRSGTLSSFSAPLLFVNALRQGDVPTWQKRHGGTTTAHSAAAAAAACHRGASRRSVVRAPRRRLELKSLVLSRKRRLELLLLLRGSSPSATTPPVVPDGTSPLPSAVLSSLDEARVEFNAYNVEVDLRAVQERDRPLRR